MKVSCKAVCTNVYASGKGNTYLDFVDLGNGGVVKMTVQGTVDLEEGQMVDLDCEVKGQVYQGRDGAKPSFNLVFQSGSFKKLS